MRMLKFTIFLLLFSCSLLCQAVVAGTARESDLKAAFVFRFAQYTKWPEPLEEELRLCLLGESEVTDAIEAYSGRLVQGVSLTPVRPSSGNIIERQCHAAFLSPQNRTQLRRWVNSLGNQSILLISDYPDAFDENADIVLCTEPNRVTFSINMTKAEGRLFTFSAQMLKLARKIR